jgi:hypothetical protein
MAEEPDYMRVEREAAEKLAALLILPLPDPDCLGEVGRFDPWSLFPLYGAYDSEFDECALAVLRELLAGKKARDDLAAEMFREMLCNLGLCDYGTSPRVCFPTAALREQLPALIEKWEAFSALHWSSAP